MGGCGARQGFRRAYTGKNSVNKHLVLTQILKEGRLVLQWWTYSQEGYLLAHLIGTALYCVISSPHAQELATPYM